MPANNGYTTPEDFLQKMDNGDLDGNLVSEIQKLSPVQLEEVASTLMKRETAAKDPRNWGSEESER